MKKWQYAITLLALCLTLVACNPGEAKEADKTPVVSEIGVLDSGGYEQLELPEIGEEIVVIETDKGKMKIRLFPADAPIAVENFLGLIEKNYYDDTVFHRIIENFMIQGGSPDGTGSGGESIFGEPFDLEVTDRLHHIRGALSMANTGQAKSQTSQFFIVHTNEVSGEEIAALDEIMVRADEKISENSEQTLGDVFPKEIIEHVKTYGGFLSLDYGYTVFGQLFEGFEVLDILAKTKVKENEVGELSSPTEPVKLIKMYTETYK